MNLVQAGIPALVYPFKQNREQWLRAERLGKKVPMTILTDADLAPEPFAGAIMKQLKNPQSCLQTSSSMVLNRLAQTTGYLVRGAARHD